MATLLRFHYPSQPLVLKVSSSLINQCDLLKENKTALNNLLNIAMLGKPLYMELQFALL